MKKCQICSATENETRIIKKGDCYYCRKHYLQIRRHGKPVDTIYDKNEIIIKDDYAEIVLKDKNSNVVGSAVIDREDVDRIIQYKWHLKKEQKHQLLCY